MQRRDFFKSAPLGLRDLAGHALEPLWRIVRGLYGAVPKQRALDLAYAPRRSYIEPAHYIRARASTVSYTHLTLPTKLEV